MTPCEEYQARIVALFDSEAGDEDLRLAAGHLQDCAECRAFCLDLIGIRRTLTSAPAPSLSSVTRQAILDGVRADAPDQERRAKSGRRGRIAGLERWAAILVIGSLLIACVALGRTAKSLRTRLGTTERQVAAIHEQAELAESQERQQKAISALYFRMAELEERVDRSSQQDGASLAAQVRDRLERHNDF